MSIPSLQHFWPSAAQTLKSVHLPIPRTHIEEVPEDQYTSEHTPAAAQLEESAETKSAMPPDASAPILPSHEQFIATLQNRTGFKFLSRNPNSLSMIESLGSSLPASEDLEEVRQRHEPSHHPANHESAHEIHKEEKREHHELKKRKDHHSFLKFLLVTGLLGIGLIDLLRGLNQAGAMKRLEQILRPQGKSLDPMELTWLQRLRPFFWPEYARKTEPKIIAGENRSAASAVAGTSTSTPAATFTDTSRPWQHPYYNSYYDYPPGYRDYPYRDPYWWRCPGERPPNRMVQWLARKYNDFFKVVCDCSYRGRY